MRTPSDEIFTTVESMERRPDGMLVEVRVSGMEFLPGDFGNALGKNRARARAVAATGPGKAAAETVVRSISEQRAVRLTKIRNKEIDEVGDRAEDHIYTIHVTR